MSEYFSQRTGNKDALPLQVGFMSPKLKNRLWNLLDNRIRPRITARGEGWFEFDVASKNLVVERIIYVFLGCRTSDLDPCGRNAWRVMKYLENKYNELTWDGVYSFIEFVLENLKFDNELFINELRNTLVEENSGYRVLNNTFVQITSEIELNEISKATIQNDGVKDHLLKAMEFLSPTKGTPNFRNSIKESISAVELQLRIIFENDKELSKNIQDLRRIIHPSLAKALENIYGYSSDAPGVRHSHKANARGAQANLPDEENATFSLVVCSAYINLIKKSKEPKKAKGQI